MMDEDSLDEQIRAAAPHIRAHPGLARHRVQILEEARGRRFRRLRLWGATVAATVALVGGGSVAMAGSGLETRWGWVADNVLTIQRDSGSACFQGMRLEWVGLADDDPLVRDGRALLQGLDLQNLDVAEAYQEGLASNARVDAEGGYVSTEEEVRMLAVQTVAAKTVFDELLDRGYEWEPGHEIWISGATTPCR